MNKSLKTFLNGFFFASIVLAGCYMAGVGFGEGFSRSSKDATQEVLLSAIQDVMDELKEKEETK